MLMCNLWASDYFAGPIPCTETENGTEIKLYKFDIPQREMKQE